MKFGKVVNYSVEIEPSQNQGFIVSVGCQRRVYSTASEMMADLMQYLTDYENVVKQYHEANQGCGELAPLSTQQGNVVGMGYGSVPEAPQTAGGR